MEILYRCCCGMDVHKKFVVACLLRIDEQGEETRHMQRFETYTEDLLRLSDWLTSSGCTHVAMESTGVYWKPIYNLLEGHLELLVVNAHHIKAVPGRKTDVKDAEWIAELLQHGLLKASFIPPRSQRDWRDLTRYRTSLVQERVRIVNRLQKVLEDANLKLAGVATDVMGKSGRVMLEAILAGATDPEQLAELAKGRLRNKLPQLKQALNGRVRAHHRFLLVEQLSHIDYLDEAIGRLSGEIAERLRPFQAEIQRFDTIPGINRSIAEVLLAEIGPDMNRFPDAHHLASWAGMCPGHNESGGKRQSGKTRKGNRWLRQALIEAAHGASHTKDTYLSSQYRRLVGRRGKKRALVAVGHSLLVIAYHVLNRQATYVELGSNYFEQLHRCRLEQNLVQRLQKLGYTVTLEANSASMVLPV
ncbi:MAG TPA: IS110 family transposase [Nitrospiraceae bacterium]|nr:IS110 family transposase [Nitrospiraceae bacterium]